MTNRIFYEPVSGFIGHTAASRLLAQEARLQEWVGFNCEEAFPAAASVLTALHAYPEATSPMTAGFNFAFGTVGKEPMFVTFEKDSKRAKRFAGAMASLTGGVFVYDNQQFLFDPACDGDGDDARSHCGAQLPRDKHAPEHEHKHARA